MKEETKKPNPIPWIRLKLGDPWDKHRSIWCKLRDECLTKAINEGWSGLSCSECDLRDDEAFWEKEKHLILSGEIRT